MSLMGPIGPIGPIGLMGLMGLVFRLLVLDDFFTDDESKDFYDDDFGPDDLDALFGDSEGSDTAEEFDIVFGKMNPVKNVEEIKRQPIIPAEEPSNPKKHTF